MIQMQIPVEVHRAQRDFLRSTARLRGFVGGRGSGKTFVGALDLLLRAMAEKGLYGLYAPTYPMLMDASWRMLLELGERLRFIRDVNRGDLRIMLNSGSEIIARSVHEPERARGPNLSGAWLDEAGLMPEEAYRIILGTLRQAGRVGWLTATFTPRGQRHWTYRVFTGDGAHLVRASSAQNPFVAREFVAGLRQAYPTHLLRQEVDGEFIDVAPGALWRWELIEPYRISTPPELSVIAVGVDPMGGGEEGECGIVVAGKGKDGRYYVLADYSLHAPADVWAKKVAAAYEDFRANVVIAEENFGGDMVRAVLEKAAPTLPVKPVRASRGKRPRAEPILVLYERGLVSHAGTFHRLEDEMTAWQPDIDKRSPNRLDALVWALSYLSATTGRLLLWGD